MQDDCGITPAQRKRFLRLAADLGKLIAEIRETCPEAEVFMEAEAGLMLLRGPLHSDKCRGLADQRENAVESHWAPGFGCGAF